MGRSYVTRGVTPPRYWEPGKGDVVYVEGAKTRISRVGTQDGKPYVWFRPHVRGTFAMSVGNLKQVARIEPRAASANPPLGKWLKAQAVRIRKSAGKLILDVRQPGKKRNPARKKSRPKTETRRTRPNMSAGERKLAGWLTILQGSAVDSGENRFLYAGHDGQPVIHKHRKRMLSLAHLASASPSGRVIVTRLVPTSLFREWKTWPSSRVNMSKPRSKKSKKLKKSK